MKIIVAGTIGRSGLGGQAWATLQYLLGFRALGHRVHYLEDCGECSWVYDWDRLEWTYDTGYPAEWVNACLARFGFGDQWRYCTDGASHGLGKETFTEICAEADLLVMRAVPLWVWRPEYSMPRRRAFIDVDPGFTQITLANGDAGWIAGISRAERRFTLAQRIGAPGCSIPLTLGPWIKTLPPVFLPEWPVAESDGAGFTSVMRWQGLRDVTCEGRTYGQRDREFPKFLDLPRLTDQRFRIAQMGIEPDMLTRHGWECLPGEAVSRTLDSYREFIQNSRAELNVPKHGYVEMNGGWFSDRSVCYLASGRPVLMEDTGLGDWLPESEGVVTFRDLHGAVAGTELIHRDYNRQRRGARALAENVFSTQRILPEFLDAAMS